MEDHPRSLFLRPAARLLTLMLGLAACQDALETCVHCGLCLSACPTFGVEREENDSPRGRLYLMQAAAEGRISTTGAFQLHIGRCLGCRACETACPAGVEYGTLLEQARADIRSGARSQGASGLPARLRGIGARVALWCLTGRPRRPTFYVLRLIRRSGMARLASHTPGLPGIAAGLLEGSRPRLTNGSRPRLADSDAQVAPRARVALFRGCVMDGLFRHVHGASRVTLGRAGYREVRLPGEGCCGALHAHAGFPEAARRMAKRNIEAFENSGAEWLAVDSAGCGAAFREYGRWLKADPRWATRARRVADRTRDVTELLDEGLGPVIGHLGGRVGYDAPCHLLHGQGVREEPLRVLHRMAGARVAELPSSSHCCGGAGVFNVLHPKLAEDVLRPKVDEVRAGGYDWVATGNPGCIMQLAAGLRRAGLDVPVVHPVELLHRACAVNADISRE